jgi:hypothetical protein
MFPEAFSRQILSDPSDRDTYRETSRDTSRDTSRNTSRDGFILLLLYYNIPFCTILYYSEVGGVRSFMVLTETGKSCSVFVSRVRAKLWARCSGVPCVTCLRPGPLWRATEKTCRRASQASTLGATHFAGEAKYDPKITTLCKLIDHATMTP